MTLAKNIRYLRKKNNYSQDDIAEMLGYKSYTTIQKWEMGTSEPPLKKLKDLACLFKVDMDDLTNIDIEKKESEPSYYNNEDTAKRMQALYEDPKYRLLFDASKNATIEDIEFVVEMLNRMRGDKD